ncbi:MAG TPA: ABC transporter permease, partial [Gemmatimonadales bacterium]|nr:ABC transporter permease [Gemmatimonadales bacterium]
MFGNRSQDDFEAEIKSHLQLEIDRLIAQGMSPADAERKARRNFGNVGVAEDRFYHGQRFASIRNAARDFKYGWRALRHSPGFLVTSVFTLALAIGAVAGMFSVVNAVLLRPLPFPEPERLVAIGGTAPGSDLPKRFGVGTEFYLHYKEKSKLMEGLFFFGSGSSTFRTGDRVERVPMAWPSNDMYATLGAHPILGRLPRPEDAGNVVVISDRLWSTWFNRDSSIIGKSYFVSDSMKQVIGVMPPEFQFPSNETMLWISSEVRLADVRPGALGGSIVARLKDGVTPEQLATELTHLSKELPDRFGGSPAYARLIGQHSAVVESLPDRIIGPALRTSLWVLLGAVAVVLLIACANVANLFMVRAESRRRDMTVRHAMGASRAQLARLQLAESFAVALIAGVLAVLLSIVTLPAFIRAAPEGVPRLDQAGLDLPTLAATFGLVILIGLACGAVPAIRASSPGFAGLRDGGRGLTTSRHRVRDVLVVLQTALALVLLIGSALLVQSFNRLRAVDPGYDIKDRYTFQFAPDQPQLVDGPSVGQLHLTTMDRLRALPGVTGVGLVNNLPLDESTGNWRFMPSGVADDGGGVRLDVNWVGGDYFQVMGIDLLAGRTLSNQEAVTPNSNAIVSRSAAQRLWPGRDALGQSFVRATADNVRQVFTVVGIVEDVKQEDWREASEAMVYFPLTGPAPRAWAFGSPAYVVKSPRADLMRNEVRALIHEIAPEAPVYREFTMGFLAKRSMVQLSFTMLTLGVVSSLALILGAVGLYGVLSYVVSQRRREIGVRMALGATAGVVRREVVSQGTKVVLIGVV